MENVGLYTPTESRIEQVCRAITGCLKPTNVENLYLLAGIAPPEISRRVCARVERTKQVERETHSLFGHTPARSRLKSRRSFLVPKTPACTWWNRPEEDLSSGKLESTHPSRTVVKSIEVFYGVESVVRGNADSYLN